MGFLLALANKKIPYIPTAKQSVRGKISPFAKPLLIQVVAYLITVIYLIYSRKFNLSELDLIETAEITYGMLAFGTIPFLMALLGLYSVWESSRLNPESPWEKIPKNLDPKP